LSGDIVDKIVIHRIRPEDKPEWLRMRHLLWSGHVDAEMLAEMDEIFSNAEEQPVFVAKRSDGELGGFLEGGTRKYADGCDTSPVGYIEGWYVDEDLRQKGVGGQLVQAMESWARTRGLVEMGSDTWLENETSIIAHGRLGYAEMERLVHFAKKL
jgi:aminoglycoside 6'-N-acetyltransferase I